MSYSTHHHAKSGAAPEFRARNLILVLVGAGLFCGIVAFVADGGIRAGFGGAALVLILTAAYCGVTAWSSSVVDGITDVDEPTPAVQLPQSPASQTYDPPVPPNHSLERSRGR